VGWRLSHRGSGAGGVRSTPLLNRSIAKPQSANRPLVALSRSRCRGARGFARRCSSGCRRALWSAAAALTAERAPVARRALLCVPCTAHGPDHTRIAAWPPSPHPHTCYSLNRSPNTHLLAHANHHTRVPWPAHDAGEHGPGSIITGKTSLKIGLSVRSLGGSSSIARGKAQCPQHDAANHPRAPGPHLHHAGAIIANQSADLPVVIHGCCRGQAGSWCSWGLSKTAQAAVCGGTRRC
jgi:hypothetical protein